MTRGLVRPATIPVAAITLFAIALAAPNPATAANGFATIDEPIRLINEHLAKAWKDNKLQPAERCSDYEFIRRASLDIIGRIATVPEIERYLKDPPATRRGLLVERLLTGEQKKEYTANWAGLWNIWLMARSGPERDRYRKDLQPYFAKFFADERASYKAMVEELITARGASNANGAVNFVLAHLG